MKKILILSLTLAFVLPVFAFVAVPDAQAACSYNGFLHSGGNCSKSYQSSNIFRFDYDDDDDDNLFGNRRSFLYRGSTFYASDSLALYIERLLRLIELLEMLRDLRGGIIDRNGGDSEIDIRTKNATNIGDDRATLRGAINFNNSDTAEVWFEYGERRNDLDEDTSKMDLDDNDDTDFSETVTDLDPYTRYYFRAVGEDEDGDRDYGSIYMFRTDSEDGNDNDNDGHDPDTTTNAADDVTSTTATLNGEVDMNDFDNGRVFFVYGEDENQIEDVDNDFDTYSEVEEDGEDLQKELVDDELDTDDAFDLEVNSLDPNTEHYFRICVEYENDNNDDTIVCGSVRSFETDEEVAEDIHPEAVTQTADNVTEDSAELSGFADMNDFNGGIVFFVYGLSSTTIEDVAADYDNYNEVTEDGANLQKEIVDSDLDTNDDFILAIDGLDPETEYSFSLCIDYEDGSDEHLACGTTESFTTLANQ